MSRDNSQYEVHRTFKNRSKIITSKHTSVANVHIKAYKCGKFAHQSIQVWQICTSRHTSVANFL